MAKKNGPDNHEVAREMSRLADKQEGKGRTEEAADARRTADALRRGRP